MARSRAWAVYEAINQRLIDGGSIPSALELWTALFFHFRKDVQSCGDWEVPVEPANRICLALRASLVAGHYFPYAPAPDLPKADAYGGVVISSGGEVLLREVAGHFGGYVWTFAKGRPDDGETPEEAALREVKEETGYDCKTIRAFPRAFGGTTSSTSFYLMESFTQPGLFTNETSQVGWFGFEEAAKRIGQTKTSTGRARDLNVLETAHAVMTAIGRVPAQ
jgi:8-oxo-dGTP pyrophosphatase MutT (NUDIX family)